MTALLIIVSISILLSGYFLMCRLDRFMEHGGFIYEPERNGKEYFKGSTGEVGMIVPSYLQLYETTGIVKLNRRYCKPYICTLPAKEGICKLHINVQKGKLLLKHQAYNPDTNRYNSLPMFSQPKKYKISNGHSLDIDDLFISTNFGYLDQLSIVNHRITSPLIFEYSIECLIDF